MLKLNTIFVFMEILTDSYKLIDITPFIYVMKVEV